MPGPIFGLGGGTVKRGAQAGDHRTVMHQEGTFRGAGDVELFWRAWRPDQPEPAGTLINLHGLGDHSGLYPAVATHFVGRGWAVHAFDLRGNGRSPGPRGHVDRWDQYRDDLHHFVDRIRAREPGPLYLMGNSLGGLVALDYVLDHPEGFAGVIAAAPPLGPLAVPGWLLALGRALSRVWPRFSWETGMDLSGLSRDPAAREAVIGDPLFHRRATARLSTEVVAVIERVQAHAPRFALPLLLLHGGADRMVPPAGTRRFAARAKPTMVEYREYPDAYHALFADPDTPQVLADIDRWLAAQ
jgi:alpha-beta hydrolase superfamily lysophospholipase